VIVHIPDSDEDNKNDEMPENITKSIPDSDENYKKEKMTVNDDGIAKIISIGFKLSCVSRMPNSDQISSTIESSDKFISDEENVSLGIASNNSSTILSRDVELIIIRFLRTIHGMSANCEALLIGCTFVTSISVIFSG
jgi:hypothetical protein